MSAQPFLLTVGGMGLIYQLNDFVVMKVPSDPNERFGEENVSDHATEQRIYDIFER